MKKFNGMLSVKNPYVWALVFSLVVIGLVAAFTTVSAAELNQVQADDAAFADLPSYCAMPGSLNVINKYGRGSSVPSNTALFRVAGDMMNLSLSDVPVDAEISRSLYSLTADKSDIYTYYGDFSSAGYLSLYAKHGYFAIGSVMTSEQFDACGGNGTYENTIEMQDGIFVIEYYLTMNVFSPTPQPRQVAPRLAPVA